MKKISFFFFLTAIFFGGIILADQSNQNTIEIHDQKVALTERPGMPASTFATWQAIVNDASLYGGNQDALSVKQIFSSIDLNKASEIAKFYNQKDFLSYQKGLVRLNQIIYRIDNHDYPAN
jgi:hypothetical protein